MSRSLLSMVRWYLGLALWAVVWSGVAVLLDAPRWIYYLCLVPVAVIYEVLFPFRREDP